MNRRLLILTFMLIISSMSFAQYWELNRMLRDLQATLEWNPATEMGFLDISQNRVVFKIGAPWLLVNYHYLIPTSGILRKDGALLFPEKTVERIKEVLAKTKKEKGRSPRVAVILIDPGHGGKDAGAIGRHTINGKKIEVLEKEIVLEVALELYDLLTGKYPDKKILLTRNNDAYIRLEERTELANNISIGTQEAIIFVSIHANASFNKKAKGFEVWYLPPDYRRELIDPGDLDEDNKDIVPILNVLLEEEYTIESITLARRILAGFKDSVGRMTENRGLKEESWFVVRNAKMPSVLVELGFITNPEEAALLIRKDYLQKMTAGIYTGINDFVYSFENTKGFTE